ncbi:MAG: ClC family H(+)/Cl(-) exchange transporter [Dialister sp.]|nr:ClC family H(+)/Cl(-) exchange transporter [Dialister sp.]
MTFASKKGTAFNRQLFKTYMELDNWHRFRFRLFLEGIAIGVLGGLAISLFRLLLELSTAFRLYAYEAYLVPALHEMDLTLLLLWLFGLGLAAFALYLMARHAPMTSGSGIPQVKGVILGLFRMRWLRILWVKIVAGALAIGAGLSLGREGPSIQIGATCAQGFSRLLGRTRMEERYLITSGASAGLAAAFNAPLAGMMFALEELHRNFSGAVLLPTMASAVTATIVTRLFFGSGTSFSFSALQPLPAPFMGYVFLLAVLCGIGGIIFNKGLLSVGTFYSSPIFKNQYVKILFALLIAFVLGFTLPDVLGGGNLLVNALARGGFTLSFLLLLLAGKYIFTLISYGCGIPGGFFLPLLVLGALIGSAFANALEAAGFLADQFVPNMIIFGMAALFAASIRSPITGTILILEMTGDFDHLMPLALASTVAYVTAGLLRGEPIYDALLKQSLQKDNASVITDEHTIVEVPVASGAPIENKPVSELPLFRRTVLVNIKRGRENKIPDPDTKIRAGDFLYILTETKNAAALAKLGSPAIPKDRVRSL